MKSMSVLRDIETPSSKSSKGGRHSFDQVLMFKILILQRYCNISDDNTEYAILDRLSFMRFLGLGSNERRSTQRRYGHSEIGWPRRALLKSFFRLLVRQLSCGGIIVKTGKMVDASFVEEPIQRNFQVEKEIIKDGEMPEDWGDIKRHSKDTDAPWTKHNGKRHFGYKNNVKADTETKLLKAYEVTTANIYDSGEMKDLIDKKDVGDPLNAVSAYRSVSMKPFYRRMGMGAVSIKRDIGTSLFKKGRRTPTRKSHVLGRGWNTCSPSRRTR
jgi:IS5 family transposase